LKETTLSTQPGRAIIVYGDSIFIRSVATMLRTNPALEIVEIRPGADLPKAGTLLPVLVLVDAAQTSDDELKTLMGAFPTPGLPFLRLNAEGQQLTVLSARQYPAASLGDLARVLEQLSITLPNS
jgi:hypothetical protein